MGLEILRFSVPELVEGQNDKLNDTLSISAVVVLKSLITSGSSVISGGHDGMRK